MIDKFKTPNEPRGVKSDLQSKYGDKFNSLVQIKRSQVIDVCKRKQESGREGVFKRKVWR
jgi:hypothetical protein